MADPTSLAESAQALFCALADYLGAAGAKKMLDTEVYPTFSSFKMEWEKTQKSMPLATVFSTHVKTPGVTLRDLESFFSKNLDWYVSSVNIAKKLISDITDVSGKFTRIKQPKWSDFIYTRGDEDVMKSVEELFKLANETQKKASSLPGGKHHLVFGDVNKWSPADIYFASEKAKRKIKTLLLEHQSLPLDFITLNSEVGHLIDLGELLPLSLKKTTKKEVTILKVNFDRKHEIDYMREYVYAGHVVWSPWVKPKADGKTVSRSFEIYFDTANKGRRLKWRHDASTAAMKFEVVETGKEAREGSIGSASILADLMSITDGNTTFSRKFNTLYETGNDKYKQLVRTPVMTQLKTRNREAYDRARSESSALNVSNPVIPIFRDWLERDKKKSTEFVRLVFSYITSRSDLSGKFVIAK